MGVGTTNPQNYDPQNQLAYSQSGVISENPSGEEVKTGAGGAAVVQPRDTLIPPGPSQTGVDRTSQGMAAATASLLLSDSPVLTPGALDMSGQAGGFLSIWQWATGFAPTITTEQQLEEQEESDSALSLFSAGADKPATTMSWDNESPSLKSGSSTGAATQDTDISSSRGGTGIYSTDVGEIYDTLVNSSKLGTDPMLTDTQRETLLSQLQTLAGIIATRNAHGTVQAS